MALDVYVGTMTRLYRGDWDNVAQRMACEQGIEYEQISANGGSEPTPAMEEIRQAVEGWCAALSRALQPHGFGPVGWDEDGQKPHFTERPGWSAFSGLLVWAAHAEQPDLPLPAEVPKSWTRDPAYQQSTAKEFKSKDRTILEPELWLPTEFPFVLEGPTLVSEKTRIGSVFTLKQQLDELHEQTAARLDELKRAPRAEAPITPKTGFFGRIFCGSAPKPEPAKPALAEFADFGLMIFRDLAAKACEHRLPMLLCY